RHPLLAVAFCFRKTDLSLACCVGTRSKARRAYRVAGKSLRIIAPRQKLRMLGLVGDSYADLGPTLAWGEATRAPRYSHLGRMRTPLHDRRRILVSQSPPYPRPDGRDFAASIKLCLARTVLAAIQFS
ncbi:hypothetical protein, partial [Cupriavidus taiwanensis]|uniref:hypothetical protein n=1 Tax=Cupriavidus taiwanensis TaxID=164546 RepID=UPI001C6EA17E